MKPLVAVALAVVLQGVATWYDAPSPSDAAAGPGLRTGDWRGRQVRVCATECVVVRLTDWCACGDRNGRPTLIDLDDEAFARIAPLSAGVVSVTVEPVIALPETSTE